MNRALKYLGFLLLTGCCVFGILYFWSDVLKPELEDDPIRYSPEVLEYTDELRDVSFTEEDTYKIQRDVDYSEGESGLWFPKGESPILAELVDEGKLPPVAERVGTEPVVIEGVNGIGNYGGTWFRAEWSQYNIVLIESFLSGATLVRWSPLGYPIVPHGAKGWESSPDMKEWTVTLRKGMKWSDGHPFTADDILFWYYQEVKLDYIEDTLQGDWMTVAGAQGEIVKIDDYTLKFIFPKTYGVFIEQLARAWWFCSPRHYMEKYHPDLGDDELIEKTMEARRLPSRKSLYLLLKKWFNPEHPRLWPWVYRNYKANPPQVFVRNPYYWAVDTVGNQLPYVDRMHYDIKSQKLIPIVAANGAVTFSIYIMDLYYTMLMTEREAGGYEVYHWFPLPARGIRFIQISISGSIPMIR